MAAICTVNTVVAVSTIANCVRQAGPCQPLARIFIDDRQRGAWDDDQLTSSFHPSFHVSCTTCSAPQQPSGPVTPALRPADMWMESVTTVPGPPKG